MKECLKKEELAFKILDVTLDGDPVGCFRKPLKILHRCDRMQKDNEKGQGRQYIRLHLFCLAKLKSWRTFLIS